MLPDLLPLDARPAPDAGQVGVKAAMLGRLIDAGFPVPPGLCVTTAAFRRALAPYADAIGAALRPADVRDPAGARAAARRIRDILIDLTIPAALREATSAG